MPALPDGSSIYKKVISCEVITLARLTCINRLLLYLVGMWLYFPSQRVLLEL